MFCDTLLLLIVIVLPVSLIHANEGHFPREKRLLYK